MSQKTHATLKGISPHSILHANQNEEKEDKKRRKQTGTDQTSSVTFSTLYSNTNEDTHGPITLALLQKS